MKLSFKDRKSVVATESLRFAADSHDSHLYSEVDTESPRETGDNSKDEHIVMVGRGEMRSDAAVHKETRSSV